MLVIITNFPLLCVQYYLLSYTKVLYNVSICLTDGFFPQYPGQPQSVGYTCMLLLCGCACVRLLLAGDTARSHFLKHVSSMCSAFSRSRQLLRAARSWEPHQFDMSTSAFGWGKDRSARTWSAWIDSHRSSTYRMCPPIRIDLFE